MRRLHFQSGWYRIVVFLLALVWLTGCLPSPSKPLGGRDSKKKETQGSTDSAEEGKGVEVPLFTAEGTQATEPAADDPALFESGPLAPPVVNDVPPAQPENRLALTPSDPPLSEFADEPLASSLPPALPSSPDDIVEPLHSLGPLEPMAPTTQLEPVGEPVGPVLSLDPSAVPPLGPTDPVAPEPIPPIGPIGSPVQPIAESGANALGPDAGDSTTNSLPDFPLDMQTPNEPVAPAPDPDSTAALQVPVLGPPPVGPIGPVDPAPLVTPESSDVALEPPAPAPIDVQAKVPVANIGGAPTNPMRSGPVPLIDRAKLFDAPDRSRARISPDGQRIAFLAKREGVTNIFVGPANDLANAKPVTHDTTGGIHNFIWAFTGRHLLFVGDGGAPNAAGAPDARNGKNVFCVDLTTEKTRNLTSVQNASAYVAAVSHKSPPEILVGINDRDPRLHDLYRVNIVSGERKLVERNDGQTGYAIDDDYRVRIAYRNRPDGGREYAVRNAPGQPWEGFLAVNPEDAVGTGIVGFNKTGDQVYFVDASEGDLSALTVIDLKGKKQATLAKHHQADVSGTLLHPTEKNVQAATFTYDRQAWKVLDARIEKDLEYLHTVEDGDLEITSRTVNDDIWTVVFRQDTKPDRYYLYQRNSQSAKLLFNSRPDLVDAPFTRMHALTIPTRDGLNLVSYLSLPVGSDSVRVGKPDNPVPMVLLVHGGPWARDVWGFNDLHQLLANRGYAVLSVNFRGSIGFGKTFTNAANREWGKKMHEDLVDAVRWAVQNRVTREDRVAIMGGSYGGYATLVGLTATPELFACGVDVCGPSNLPTLMQNPLSTWAPYATTLGDRVGDVATPAGREFLQSRSPSRFVDQIRRPLLIAQGGEDQRATQQQADSIVQTMRQKGVPVTYLLYPDEGHGLSRRENRLAFYAAAETFLAKYLGGRSQPIGAALAESSARVLAGGEGLEFTADAREAGPLSSLPTLPELK